MQTKAQQNSTTHTYEINNPVFIVSLKKKGIVKEINGNQLLLTFFDYDNQRQIKQFSLNEIKPWKENKITNKRNPLQIKIKYFDDTLPKIEKIEQGEWIDLRAAVDVELKQFEYKLIPLGIGMKLPFGFEVNIVSRSSTFKNFGILQTNSFGVIDNSYSGNLDQYFFPALAMRDTKINKGDRICQFRLNRIMPNVELIEVEFLDETSRGGLGSTGKS